MVGVNLAPDGNNSEQLAVIKEKMSRRYAEYIRVAMLINTRHGLAYL